MTDREKELPMTEHDLFVEERLDNLEGRIRHCFRSAFRHLRRSWLLHHVDNEMSAFRAITAEEEAAAGLLLALKLQSYPGSDQLKHHNHSHKMAVHNMMVSVSELLSELHLPNVTMQINKSGPPKVMIKMDVSGYLGLSEPLFAQPDNPLNILVTIEGDTERAATTFSEKLNKIYTGAGFLKFESYLSAEANRRNTPLYAADSGVPSIEFEDAFILTRLGRVRAIGLVTIAILQDPTKQLLVRQCIETFLAAMPRLKQVDDDLSVAVYRQLWTKDAKVQVN